MTMTSKFSPRTGDRRVKAAYLVDPVDNTSQTPESPAYPSAVRALRAAGLPVGITGASIASSCNPTDANHLVGLVIGPPLTPPCHPPMTRLLAPAASQLQPGEQLRTPRATYCRAYVGMTQVLMLIGCCC